MICIGGNAGAQLRVEGTRLIYPGKDREASINIINRSNEDVVMQSWISKAEDNHDEDIPFAILQPLTLLPPKSHKLLRVLYAGQGLPSDKESMFWLNIVEIPRKTEHSVSMQFSIRQRLKFFYRPTGLHGTASDALQSLQWNRRRQSIEILNPSSFHISLIDLALEGAGLSQPLSDYVFLQPGASVTLDTRFPVPADSHVTFTEIADSGLLHQRRASLH